MATKYFSVRNDKTAAEAAAEAADGRLYIATDDKSLVYEGQKLNALDDKTAAKIADTAAALTAETKARTAADDAINQQIAKTVDSLTAADTEEANARVEADSTLQGYITAEATARQTADNELTARLTGRSDNSNPMTDPYKWLGRFPSTAELRDALDGISFDENAVGEYRFAFYGQHCRLMNYIGHYGSEEHESLGFQIVTGLLHIETDVSPSVINSDFNDEYRTIVRYTSKEGNGTWFYLDQDVKDDISALKTKTAPICNLGEFTKSSEGESKLADYKTVTSGYSTFFYTTTAPVQSALCLQTKNGTTYKQSLYLGGTWYWRTVVADATTKTCSASSWTKGLDLPAATVDLNEIEAKIPTSGTYLYEGDMTSVPMLCFDNGKDLLFDIELPVIRDGSEGSSKCYGLYSTYYRDILFDNRTNISNLQTTVAANEAAITALQTATKKLPFCFVAFSTRYDDLGQLYTRWTQVNGQYLDAVHSPANTVHYGTVKRADAQIGSNYETLNDDDPTTLEEAILHLKRLKAVVKTLVDSLDTAGVIKRS